MNNPLVNNIPRSIKLFANEDFNVKILQQLLDKLINNCSVNESFLKSKDILSLSNYEEMAFKNTLSEMNINETSIIPIVEEKVLQ